MKIYPNTSNIMVTTNINTLTDIPLSYVDTQKVSYKIKELVWQTLKNQLQKRKE